MSALTSFFSQLPSPDDSAATATDQSVDQSPADTNAANQASDPNAADPNATTSNAHDQSTIPNTADPNVSGDPDAGAATTIPEVTVEGDPNANEPDLSGNPASVADADPNAAQPASDAQSPAVLAAVPATDPGVIETIEEGVVSGVRAIGSAAPEAVEATETAAEAVAVAVAAPIALGALAVGAAAGAAVLLWSSDAGAAWDGATNPETGKPYTSQEEYDRVQASQRDKRRNAQPLPPPVEGVDYDNDGKPFEPTCASLGIPLCDGSQRGFENLKDAEDAEPNIGQWQGKVNSQTMKGFEQFPEGQNSHRTYYDENGNKLFTLVKTPCCTDTPSGPVLTWRWSSDAK